MAIPAWLLSIVPLLTKKPKPCVLGYWDGMVWSKQTAPLSARQCRKEMKKLVGCGMKRENFRIFREGTKFPKEGPKGAGH